MTRRKLIQLGAAAATVAAVGVAADGLLYEALEPRLTRVEVPLARLPEALDGLTVAQLSDFHYGPFTVTPIRRAVELVNGLKPDLIVLTGDFVTIPIWNEYLHVAKRAARAAEPCAELLAPLTAKLGKYVALGNHDRDSDPGFITECLQARGMPVLRNSSTPIEISGKRLWLAGVDDSLVGKPDLDVTLRNIPATEPVILLAHEPDYADAAKAYPVDLQLSGHSHGGQIRLPVVGPAYLPWGAKRYPMGMYRLRSLILYTNVGLGTIRVPMRLNCPPEVTLFTLRAGTK